MRTLSNDILVGLGLALVVVLFLGLLALVQPAVSVEPATAGGANGLVAHYAPDCEAADAISWAPESDLGQWYAEQAGNDAGTARINCMGR